MFNRDFRTHFTRLLFILTLQMNSLCVSNNVNPGDQWTTTSGAFKVTNGFHLLNRDRAIQIKSPMYPRNYWNLHYFRGLEEKWRLIPGKPGFVRINLKLKSGFKDKNCNYVRFKLWIQDSRMCERWGTGLGSQLTPFHINDTGAQPERRDCTRWNW